MKSISPVIALLIIIISNESCSKCSEPIIYNCDSNFEPFSFVEQMPQYPGGNDSLNSFILKNLIYPQQSKVDRIEGTSQVQFVVNVYGNLDCIKIAKSLNSECDNEALRLVNLMPNWIPGKHNGKEVYVSIALPIVFKL